MLSMSKGEWNRDPSWTRGRIGRVAELVGGPSALARILGVKPITVSRWISVSMNPDNTRYPIARHRHAMEALERQHG